jgi:hypothetical protein
MTTSLASGAVDFSLVFAILFALTSQDSLLRRLGQLPEYLLKPRKLFNSLHLDSILLIPKNGDLLVQIKL